MADKKPTGATALKEIRDRTGLPVMECVRLLAAANGDIERAMELRFTLPSPPKPAKFACPECAYALTVGNRSECPRCGWLRFPGNRDQWGRAGACPRCGFGYRWDGGHCSHCGHGTSEDRRVLVE
jgi:hypothetical protein